MLKKILSFFKKDRINYFLITALTYVIGKLIPKEFIDKYIVAQVIIALCAFTPIVLYHYAGWQDNSRPERKRNFSRFCFFFFTLGVYGAIISTFLIKLIVNSK